MRAACGTLQQQLDADPTVIEGLSNLRKQFLRWVMHTYMRPRALDLWLDRMNYRAAIEFFGSPGEDLYPDPHDPDYVTGHIEELVHLATGFGAHRRVVFLCDLQRTPASWAAFSWRRCLGGWSTGRTLVSH